jgi:(1->4)-alpha-D-glucan 1-alpha-D-glucosylmutase
MNLPTGTYRIQLNKDFTLEQLQHIIDYLQQLGISTIYASPITMAAPGSLHGYDVSDPHRINPEIGSAAVFRTVVNKLAAKNMSWLQDIVPNHMSFSPSNFRLMDVLERDAHSEFYRYFDMNLLHPAPDLNGKLLVPFLGADLHTCIEKGEITLSFTEAGFTVDVYDTRYPFSTGAYFYLAAQAEEAVVHNTIKAIAEKASSPMPYDEWKETKEEWVRHCVNDAALRKGIEQAVARINKDKEKWMLLLQQQHYTLSHWQRTGQEINYRRFFTVNSLICLRMEDEQVFDDYHRFLRGLCSEGLIQGLRIDHIDGLYDPTAYIERLRAVFGEDCYIVAEKILEASEKIPRRWKLQGTSGYEFLAYTNRLLTSREGAEQLKQFYNELIPGQTSYPELVTEKKTLILEKYMGGEWENLVRYFFELQLQENFDREKIKKAMAALMIAMPVYRIYAEGWPLTTDAMAVLKKAFEKARQLEPGAEAELRYMEELFTGNTNDENKRNHILHFMKRYMQFTGPLTAKGVEDTSFYVYNPLISHNEVGDDPAVPAITVGEFHDIMKERWQHTPLSLNASATHDTKRGEDARLRINVLSELIEEWRKKVPRWVELNRSLHNSANAPTLNDEYFLYQSIIGGIPGDLQITDEWIERVQDFMVKAVREAKVNSNWEAPNEEYENACTDFIKKLFDGQHPFLDDLLPFAKKIIEYTSIYSLAQTVIKMTAPGIPDVYQGTELWDLSFVDPDNRRAVDYGQRKDMLSQIIEKEKEGNKAVIGFIKDNWQAGYEKLFVTWKMLHYRKNNPRLFTEGEYIPINIEGKETEGIAYARQYDGQQLVVVAPLGIAHRFMNRVTPVKKWTGTMELPVSSPAKWKNIFTGESFITGGQLALQDIFKSFPVAVLEQQPAG